jgi:G3E family GTPase
MQGVLRSKGFVWLANTPELVWEWSTAGRYQRFP